MTPSRRIVVVIINVISVHLRSRRRRRRRPFPTRSPAVAGSSDLTDPEKIMDFPEWGKIPFPVTTWRFDDEIKKKKTITVVCDRDDATALEPHGKRGNGWDWFWFNHPSRNDYFFLFFFENVYDQVGISIVFGFLGRKRVYQKKNVWDVLSFHVKPLRRTFNRANCTHINPYTVKTKVFIRLRSPVVDAERFWRFASSPDDDWIIHYKCRIIAS